ncbi:trypsin inhibitor-like [Trichoplusia ni]|uniref:Trypsin inhibitor-like n=1 Tax=Trichoplusia ni TaxID=7111 RepID=A0A7E5WNE3_TRINI|nr:trypsin inhibitor-like [Trichoplusia ni]
MKCLIFVLFVAVIAMASYSEAHLHLRCEQPIEKGRCHGHFPKYGYDQEKKECVEFVFSGCGGNTNRFHTKRHCEISCML